jgi:hypothetical protein
VIDWTSGRKSPPLAVLKIKLNFEKEVFRQWGGYNQDEDAEQ